MKASGNIERQMCGMENRFDTTRSAEGLPQFSDRTDPVSTSLKAITLRAAGDPERLYI